MRPRSLLLTCVGVALAVAVYAVLAPDALPQLREDRRDNAQREADIVQQRAANAALEREVAALAAEGPAANAAVEQAARRELGFVKKNEVVLTGLPVAPAPAPQGDGK